MKDRLRFLRRFKRIFKLQPGSRIEFVIDCLGEVKVFPLDVPVANLAGILHRPDRPVVSIEDMDQAIQEQIHDWA